MKRLPLLVASALILADTLAGVLGVSAQTYPSRPITMVVPLAAGGPLDTNARILADPMREWLGQPVVVENVTGAGGTVGTGRLARAAPDGYTFGVGFLGTHVLNGALYALNYDVVNDFEPIALVSSSPHMIIAKATVPANNLAELIAWLKLNADKVSAGNSGIGSTTHIAEILFQKVAGVRFQMVPYRGAAPALQDVVAGQIDLMVDVASNSLPYLGSGRIKAYAVTAASRYFSAPEIPTVDEAGLPGLYIASWYGLFGPKGMPKETVAKLNAAAMHALADPAVRARFAVLGLEIPPPGQQTAEALAAFQKAEIEKWWPIIKAAGLKGD